MSEASASGSNAARLRVAYVDHCAQLSGGEIALLRMLKALRGSVDAHVILGEDGPLAERLEETGAVVEVLPMGSDLRETRKETVTPGGVPVWLAADLARYVRTLTRRLRSLRPDVVHTNSLKAALYGGIAARAAGVPLLWHVRDRIAPDYLPRPAVALVRALSLGLPSAVVVNSRATAATLPRRSTVVYDVVPDVGVPPPRGHVDHGTLVVGMLGRLSPWKGQHVFLEALAATRASGHSVRARLIGSAMFGEDAYEQELHALVDRLGLRDVVEFRGFREDPWSELAELDVLVHASTVAEPFGQVVIEGMAARLPVIAARAGGPAEIVTDGVDGLLVPPGEVAGLAAALVRLADEPALRGRLADAGLQTSARYRPPVVARKIFDVYEAMTSGRAVPGGRRRA